MRKTCIGGECGIYTSIQDGGGEPGADGTRSKEGTGEAEDELLGSPWQEIMTTEPRKPEDGNVEVKQLEVLEGADVAWMGRAASWLF